MTDKERKTKILLARGTYDRCMESGNITGAWRAYNELRKLGVKVEEPRA